LSTRDNEENQVGASTTVADGDDAGTELRAESLAVSHVSAGYGGALVLHDISLTLAAGQVMALLGANGAGKSTLLRTISGLIKPTAGRISILGEDVTKSPPHRRTSRGLCEIPEGRGIFPSLTVRENLVLLSPRRRKPDATAQALDMFPVLKGRMSQTAGSLSGGEQQMLAVARAIIDRPAVVLFDEVSLGLAPLIVDRIYDAVRAIITTGSAVLLVEQYVDRALDLADSALVLDRGTVAYSGSASQLRSIDLLKTYLGAEIAGTAT
jgi:branched-chain amino acid transport system ATP-binding protein